MSICASCGTQFLPRYPGQELCIDCALDKFEEAGSIAWADVPDAAEWQRNIRRCGNDVQENL